MRNHRAIAILIWCVALVGLLTTAVIVYNIVTPEPFQALEYREVSIKKVNPDGVLVIPQVPGQEAPSVYVGDVVPLFFKQCSLRDEEFEAIYTTGFVHETTGIIYMVAESQRAVIAPGCSQIRVDVPMPDKMVEDIKSQEQDIGNTWSFHGHLIPQIDHAEQTDFRSEQFYIAREAGS